MSLHPNATAVASHGWLQKPVNIWPNNSCTSGWDSALIVVSAGTNKKGDDLSTVALTLETWSES